MSKTLIRWKLSEVMARHRVLAKDLADFLGISRNAVSALRKAETMPEIGGDRWEQVASAINALSKIGETITPFDLIEYLPQKDSADQKYPAEKLDLVITRSKKVHDRKGNSPELIAG